MLVIRLNCTTEAQKARELGAAIAAIRLEKDYSLNSSSCLGTEPEGFAEEWFRRNISPHNPCFEDRIMYYFLQILRAKRAQNG